ncbi:hypothetical protein FSP39_000462 [Pinctada imbricata]|uniref:NADPH oxidase 5 n=1 Tax=Pinctada imbricata TaxID=66713 RepID=A0AA89C083_PINIB|nr:hypothetical protein FSP39_000462 [Pinctada imbricata]
MEYELRKLAGEDGDIDLHDFKVALKMRKSFFAERFFHLFDKGEGTTKCQKLIDGLRTVTKGTESQKLKFLFDVYDVNGRIEREELQTVLESCLEESSLYIDEGNLHALTDILMDIADSDGSGSITYEDLATELKRHQGVADDLRLSTIQLLKPKESTKTKYFTWTYIKNNVRKVWFFVWYVLMNLGLGAYSAWSYSDHHALAVVARVCGMNLYFHCMFVFVLMLRKSITNLQMVRIIAAVLPLDQHILIHKMVGIMIAVYSLVHTIAHIAYAVVLDNEDSSLTAWEILFTTNAGVGWVESSAYITGWILLLILLIMLVCSLPFVREVFYIAHTLYVPFLILVLLHSPNFWKWFVGPGTIFLVEKILRSKLVKWIRYGNTFIEEVNLLPAKVCHLSITKNEKFEHKPGDYIFLQIPDIAAHEWHPFTISSAPEMKGHLWVHVRSAGHWTKKLYEFFSNLDPEYPEGKDEPKISIKDNEKRSNKIFIVEECFVDGPYSTPSHKVFETEHAILIGGGIGVTPMASILQSVIYRYKEIKRRCPNCSHEFHGTIPKSHMKLRKVDFIWVNRDQGSFEWFTNLLTELETEEIDAVTDLDVEPRKVIEIHLYMTAAQTKTDIKGVGLQVALDLLHQKEKKCLITGLKTRTKAGRPNWHELFTKKAEENKGKIHVFFCGPDGMGKTIKENCRNFKFEFSKEKFW